MKITLGIILVTIFVFISGFHLYWAFGGKYGFKNVLPTDKNGKRIINPGRIATIIVSFGLLLFAFYYLLKIEIIHLYTPKRLYDISGWIIPSIFILRFFGDFKYIGIFKKIKDTRFGKYDTKYSYTIMFNNWDYWIFH